MISPRLYQVRHNVFECTLAHCARLLFLLVPLQLLVSCSDNNVKLIVLDRLQELKDKHKDVMQVSTL